MIVTDDQVAAALGYIGDDEGAGAVKHALVTAENKSRETFARLFLSYDGTVAEREARATCNPEYQEAKAIEADCSREMERHKSRVRQAEMIFELWRSENANARAAERVR